MSLAGAFTQSKIGDDLLFAASEGNLRHYFLFTGYPRDGGLDRPSNRQHVAERIAFPCGCQSQ